MKNKTKVILTLIFIIYCGQLYAQRVVFDSRHFAIVNENALVRNAAEMSHNEFLDRINKSIEKIELNCATLTAAQALIYGGLSNVNSAVRSGMTIKNMSSVCSDILRYSMLMADLAKAEPYLLLFAEEMSRDMNSRALKLFSEVSGFVLKEGNNVLMDYGTRDELLKKVSVDLQIISGLSYGAWKAMYYAKVKGVFKTLNPFASFINQDRALVENIIQNTKYLKR